MAFSLSGYLHVSPVNSQDDGLPTPTTLEIALPHRAPVTFELNARLVATLWLWQYQMLSGRDALLLLANVEWEDAPATDAIQLLAERAHHHLYHSAALRALVTS